MRGFVVVFKGAYEIASLSSRKIRRWADRLRSLRAFVRASARQKPVDRYYFLLNACLLLGNVRIVLPSSFQTKIRDIYWFTVIAGLIRGLTCGAFAFSFALMQKKQKIKENTIAPRVFPCLRAAKAGG